MAYQLTDNELYEILKGVKLIFDRISLPLSFKKIDQIISFLQTSIKNKKIDRTQLNTEFKSLQTQIESEFPTTQYRMDIQKDFLKAVRRSFKLYLQQVIKIVNHPSMIKIVERRTRSLRNLFLLRKIIYGCAKSNEEKAVGISQIYLSIVDGLYRGAIRDCYIWILISHGQSVNPTSFTKSDVRTIHAGFVTNNFDRKYFEGWNSVVRNAVAHSTFHYDAKRNKIVYEDLIANSSTELTISEVSDLCDKLYEVFLLVLIRNQISRVNDVCDVLSKRYP